MKRMLCVVIVAALSAASAGCEPDSCARMQECCSSISTQPWVGNACDLTSQAKGAAECKAVLSAIQASAEGGGHTIGDICK